MTTEETLTLANDLLVNWVWSAESERPEPNRLDVRLLSSTDLMPMVVGLRVQRLGYLAAITGLDPGPESDEMEVLYHFCAGQAVVTLRVSIPREGGAVATLSDVIPSAEVYERELSEMFGVAVTGLRKPQHLYLPDDWPDGVYPLLKDADLSALPAAMPAALPNISKE
jgi:Ni,Fe-hydrogenase III component G